jgi:hypothetical protein
VLWLIKEGNLCHSEGGFWERKEVFCRGVILNTVVDRSMTKAGFLEYLEHYIVCSTSIFPESDLDLHQLPLCSSFPGKLSVLCFNNACIHREEEILELSAHFDMTQNFQQLL